MGIIKEPIMDPGTPEEEAMRYRCLPLSLQYHRYLNLKKLIGTKYHYYNHPEGEDLAGKLIHMNGLIIGPATFWGIYDAVAVQQKKTLFTGAVRILHWVWPACACATAFGTAAYAATKIRGKDDFGNWIIGSLAAGSVIGKWAKNGFWGWNAFFLFTLVAGSQRIAHMEGWKFFHEFDKRSYLDIKDAESVRWHKVSRGTWGEIFTDVEKGYTTKH